VKPAFVDVESWRTSKTEQYVTGPSDEVWVVCWAPWYLSRWHVHEESSCAPGLVD
jgi:hypothetical protein